MNVRTLDRQQVHTIDLLDFKDKGSRSAQVAVAQSALKGQGFLVLERSPIDLEHVKACYAAGEAFFLQPLEKKLEIDHRTIDQKAYGDTGYYPYLTETAIGHQHADLKEFFHLNPLITPDDPMSEHYAVNRWPSELPQFRPCFEKLYAQLEETGRLLLRLVGLAKGMDTDVLVDAVSGGKHVLRMLHYPTVEEKRAEEGAMRAAPHTGINMIGIQLPASHPGLEFCQPDGEWVTLNAEMQRYPTVNIGEIVSLMHGGDLKPTLHQVVNTQEDGRSRWAIVFFFVPNPTKSLAVRNQAGGIERVVSVGDLLLERFGKIGTRRDAAPPSATP